MPNRGALNTPAQIANIVRAMAEERNDERWRTGPSTF